MTLEELSFGWSEFSYSEESNRFRVTIIRKLRQVLLECSSAHLRLRWIEQFYSTWLSANDGYKTDQVARMLTTCHDILNDSIQTKKRPEYPRYSFI